MINEYTENKGMKHQFIDNKNIIYYGRILNPTQCSALKKYGNTVISEELLKHLGKKRLIEEIESLTGLEVDIDVTETKYYGNFVIVRVYGSFPPIFMPDTLIDTSHKKYFIVYLNQKEKVRFLKSNTTLAEVREFVKMSGVTDFEVR